MADYFQSQPNFVNPQYATPEQLAMQRAYAAELTRRSGQDVNRPTGALANMINALTGNLARNRADTLQSEAAARNAERQSSLISQLQSGQKIDPQNLAQIYSDPMASPETRALVTHLIQPQKAEDVMGRPGYASPVQGVQAAPIQGTFQPGFRAPESAGSVSTTTPFPAPMPQPRPMPMTPTNPQGGTFGGLNFKPAGWDGPPPTPQAATGGGGQAPGAGLPPAPAPVASGSRIDALAAKDRELTATKTFTQGGAESITGVQKEDVAAAMNAPTIKRIAGTMMDDLRTHGDKMTFGPTADWSNSIKRVAANYAPGPMKDQLEALASADSFDKMSAQLTSMLAKGGGTDAQLFNNMRSVPGAHNSKQGAEALLKMVIQVADQQQALRNYVSGARNIQEYEALRSRFFQENPVINPITGNPVMQDLQNRKSAPGGGARIISVEPVR
jgi:hypothetical protein